MFGARRTVGVHLAARLRASPRVVASESLAAQFRRFSVSAAVREAHLLDMPSMSPTMEEGGIIEWKVKPGESFSTGDVLLEIETDKAEIAVEAVDDGVLAQILMDAGAKGVSVGKPIAVVAEQGDDLSSIDVNALLAQRGGDSGAAASAPEESSPAPAEPESPAPASEPSAPVPAAPSHGSHGTDPLPSAVRLMHEHHLEAKDIKGTGPFGRITKGDVLTHLGKIPGGYVNTEASRVHEWELPNLSYVAAEPAATESAAVAEGENAKPQKEEPEKPKPIVTTISIPVDAESVQKASRAKQQALRAALLSLKPRPSVLRDPALDALTASTKPPFVIKSAKVQIFRAKPVSYDVVVEEPPAPKSNPAVEVFVNELRAAFE